MSEQRHRELQQLPDDYLICRGYGHAWEVKLSAGAKVPADLLLRIEDDLPPDARKAIRNANVVQRNGWRTEFKRCTRSGSTVLSLWDRGHLVYQYRTWPPGYLLPAGAEDHYIVEAQLELWHRVVTP